MIDSRARTCIGFRRGIPLPLILAVFLCAGAEAVAQDVAVPPPVAATASAAKPIPPPPPPFASPRPGQINADLPVFRKIGPGVFALGDIRISKPARSISLPALVNMNKGLLEYVLVRTGGKTHESLFRTPVDPTQLQLAMLLVGAEGTDRPLARQGDPQVPKGNSVDIEVNYLRDGRMVRIKPENWIARKSGNEMTDAEPLHWVFTGSEFSNGKFMAQAEGSIIAIYHDPVALIDNASAGGESDKIWFVKEGATLPVGTPVTLTISIKN